MQPLAGPVGPTLRKRAADIVPAVFRLTCATRDYDWGSTSLIPRFLGLPADGSTQAELWVGAHPGDPARLPDDQPLDAYLRSHPDQALGDRVVGVFGDRLPFLVKALAAAQPLSLQVHPTSSRARIGYDLEDEAGIAVGAPERSYQDRFHKPEMILALTRFEGMAGFRDIEKSARILRLLEHPWATSVADQLESGPAYQALHAVVAEILGRRGGGLSSLVAEVAEAAHGAEGRSHQVRKAPRGHYVDRSSVERESTRVFAQVPTLAARYPDDPGVLVTLLLNHVVLSPGEAMFLDAGVVHAYTSGFGVEVMASSDNVVRAGLTSKHVDVPELLHIANFTPMPPPLWEPTTTGSTSVAYRPPVTEFDLTVAHAPSADLPADGPRVLLVLEGALTVTCSSASERLVQGEALFVEHADGPIEVSGTGRVAVAAVPPG